VELLVDNSGHSENISNTEEPNPIEQDEPSTSMPRRSGRNAQTPSYLDDYFTFLGEVHSLVKKKLLVAHYFGLCVAHMGCTTIATPLVTIYQWRISICATHNLPMRGVYCYMRH
jgi:hypothetical protein